MLRNTLKYIAMKKHTTLFFSIVFMLPFVSKAQLVELIWAHDHGYNANAKINATVRGADESLYSTGHYNGTVDFDPSSDTYELDNDANIFIQKLDYAGELIWVKNFVITDPSSNTGWYIDEGTGIALDTDDNVITTGNFDTALDFDPGDDEFILTPQNNFSNFFVQKMDSEGAFLWAINIDGAQVDLAAAVTTDADNNIYVTGTFNDQVDFDPDPDNEILLDADQLTGWGSAATFILKIDSEGNVIWAHDIPNDNKGGNPHDIVTDSESNVYITGYFTGLTDFGTDGIEGIVTGAHDCYLVKFDTDGNYLWMQVLSSTAFNIGNALAIDPEDNVYLTGKFGASVDFDRGDEEFILTALGYEDAFIQKLDAEGELIWVKQIGGSGSTNAHDISVETHGKFEVYITGTFSGTTDFDPNAGVYNMSVASSGFWSQEVFFEKLDENGAYEWAEQIDNSQQSSASTIFPTLDGGVLISGVFNGSPDFDPTDNNFVLSATGGQSAFMAKYKLCSSQTFGYSSNTLDPIHAECDITALPIPDAVNGCGIHIQGTPDINLPITEEGDYMVNWTYENTDGQIITQLQELTLYYTNTNVNHIANYLSAEAEGYFYQWVDCDNSNAPVPGATEKDFYPTSWGNYAVQITNEDGCSYLSECLNYFGVELTENQFDTAIHIYPNPTSGLLNIDLNQKYETLKVTIVDILGNEVQHFVMDQSNTATLQIEAAKGWYFVEIENELGAIARTKILKN